MYYHTGSFRIYFMERGKKTLGVIGDFGWQTAYNWMTTRGAKDKKDIVYLILVRVKNG